jgi:thiosulfate reductase cytochrome b subunit
MDAARQLGRAEPEHPPGRHVVHRDQRVRLPRLRRRHRRERLLPVRAGDVAHTIRDTLHFKLAHEDLTTYNAVQKLLYMLAIAAAVSQVITGLALWKPVQLQWIVAVLGGFQSVRVIHFAGMAILVGFLVVHVALSLLVPRTLLAMLGGGARLPPRIAPGAPVRADASRS